MGNRHHAMSWEERQIFAQTILDLFYDDLRDHFEREEYDKVDEFLTKVPVKNTEEVFLIGVLQATLEHADLLPSRSSFYHRVYAEVRRTRSEKDTQDLLGRLDGSRHHAGGSPPSHGRYS